MVPVKKDYTTFPFGAPKGEEENVNTLWVEKGIDPQMQVPVSQSVWKLTEEELREINQTGEVHLRIFGNGHPVVSLHVNREDVLPLPNLNIFG